MGLKVTAALVICTDVNGASHHFYRDEVLPSEGLDKDHVAMLVKDGMVMDEKAAAKADATPDGSDPKPAKKAATKKAAAKKAAAPTDKPADDADKSGDRA